MCVCVFLYLTVACFRFFRGFPFFFDSPTNVTAQNPSTAHTNKKRGADIRTCSLDCVAKEARVCTRNNRRALLFKVTRTLKRK